MENKYKSYSDTYLYQQHPIYTKTLTDAIMKDPIIDKSSNMFSDVLYVIKYFVLRILSLKKEI